MRNIPTARVLLLNYRPSPADLKRLATVAGLYFDTARVESTDGVATLLRGLPAGRAVFGTHAPFLIYESALIRVVEAGLEEQETAALLSANALALIDAMRPSADQ